MTKEEAINRIVRLAKVFDLSSNTTAALDKAVGALREQIEGSPRWISVKDALPEDKQEVLAYYGFDPGNRDRGIYFAGVLTYEI